MENEIKTEVKEQEFEIAPEAPEAKSEIPTEEEVSELGPEEVEMAKESGIITGKKVEGEDEKTETKPAEETKKVEGEPENKTEPLSEEEKLNSYNKNEKGLYWKTKNSVRRAQEAERKEKVSQIRLIANKTEIARLKKQLEDSGVIDNDPEKVLTQADLKAHDELKDLERQEKELEVDDKTAQANSLTTRLNDQEQEARSKDANFDNICTLAAEVMTEDKSEVYAMKMQAIAANPEGYVPDFLYQLAKLNPKYGETVKSAPKVEDKKTKINVERMVANSQKRNSSAAVSGGGSETRRVSESELTPEDVGKMSDTQRQKLSTATLDRILYESCAM